MKITAAAAVLPVSNIEASLLYFKDVLGFSQEFRFGNYAGIERDKALIHLSQHSSPSTGTPGSGAVYLFCDEVDSYFEAIVARGVVVDVPPRDYPYGMRDFVVFDPDRNKVSFGCPTKRGM